MQPLHRISEAERRYLLDGVAQGVRNDGRGYFDLRRVAFEVAPVSTATASCRLRAGETEILVGVKCDVAKPSAARPDVGQLHLSVECAASVSVAFADGRDAEDVGRQLAVLLEALCFGEDVVDRRALCLLPGIFAWEVHVDVLVLASGGNLLDSVSLAVAVALGETRLPKVTVEEAMEEDEVTQLKVDDRPEMGTPLPIKRQPLCITAAQIQGRLLLDVTPEEELCADAMTCVVVDAKCGDVVGLHKLGRGRLDPAVLPGALERCRAAAAALGQQLDREVTLGAKGL